MHDIPKYQIQAFWDQEAEVWVAQSKDILGLVTESPTLEQLILKLRQMIPELLAANHHVTPAAKQDIIFELITRREESISVA
ncbi:MAG: DUF1902 domain-containing protein [Synechocystis sp.]|nr:DUF1902 domain-containing protein [Synechocystis sp.]